MLLTRNDESVFHVVFRHEPQERRTTCRLIEVRDNGVRFEVGGVAYCGRDDQYNRRIGRVVALGRAIDSAAATSLMKLVKDGLEPPIVWKEEELRAAIKGMRRGVLPLYLKRMPQDRFFMPWLEAYSGQVKPLLKEVVDWLTKGTIIEVDNELDKPE